MIWSLAEDKGVFPFHAIIEAMRDFISKSFPFVSGASASCFVKLPHSQSSIRSLQSCNLARFAESGRQSGGEEPAVQNVRGKLF